jgi:4-amino-4-deoxy-L-arabinose transferase-like glycosyltransferase
VARADRRLLCRWAVSIIIAGAVVRVGWAAWIAHAEHSAVRSPDTPTYLGPARALIDAARFSVSPTDPTPMFVRTPGYPAFLAPVLWLTDSEWAISPMQAAVSALAAALIVLVGRRLLGLTAGLAAGALVMLDPLQFVASGTLLTEAVTTVVLVAIVAVGAVVFALRNPKDLRSMPVLALGALVAVAALVRPTFWFYPVMIVGLLAVRFRHLPRRVLAARLLAFILPVAVVVGGWQLRNHTTAGSWQLSGISSVNLYCYDAAEVETMDSGRTLDVVLDEFGCPPRDAGWGWMSDPGAGERLDEWGRRGVQILLEHPAQYARVLAGGIVRQIAGPGTDTVARYLGIDPSPALTAVLFVWNALLWGVAVVGMVVGLRSTQRAFWVFVAATVAYVIVISAGQAAYARFRTPVVPLLALLAAYGLHRSVTWLRGRQPGSLRAEERELTGTASAPP